MRSGVSRRPSVQSQLDRRLSPHLPQPVNAAFVCCKAGKQISELHCHEGLIQADNYTANVHLVLNN